MSSAGTVVADTAGADAAAAQAAAAAAAQKPWYDGADELTVGHIKNRGWDKDAKSAAFAAIKAHQEAEKHLGAPANSLVRLPKDASDEAGRKALYAKLGVPDDEKGYVFKDIKFSDGTELDEAFTSTMSKAFLNAGVTKENAPAIVKEVVKFMEDQDKLQASDDAAKMAKEADELVKSWGTNMKANEFIANQAAEKLGLGKDILNTMANVAGRTAVAQALLKMGQMMGEDKFVQNPSGQPGLMTREQVAARMKELQNDQAWVDRLMRGDARANQEFDNLTRLMAAA